MMKRKIQKLRLRPQVDFGVIFEFFGLKMFSRKHLKLKGIHQSLPTGWELIRAKSEWEVSLIG